MNPDAYSDAIPVVPPKTVCRACVLLKHSDCVNYDGDVELGGCICPSARHQRPQAEIMFLEGARGRSLDDLLAAAFEAGREYEQVQERGNPRDAANYDEWRRSLTS